MKFAMTGAVLMAGALVWGCGGAKKAEQQTPQLDSSTLARKAESMMQAGRTSEALQIIDEAVALDPQKAPLHFERGTILFRAGRYAEAESAFKRVLELDRYFTDAENFLGSVCAELNRFDEALEHYRRALADPAYPTPELVLFNIGLLYRKQARDAEALTELRRAVEINPKYYEAHFELASTLDTLGKLSEAASEYEVAGPGFRYSGDYYYRLGFAYVRLGDKQKARDNLRRAIDVSPGSESAARADELLRMLQ